MSDTHLCHKCEHPLERHMKCRAPGCVCPCRDWLPDSDSPPDPEERSLPTDSPYARGYADANNLQVSPDALRHRMFYLGEFTRYLDGYDAGSRPGVSMSKAMREQLIHIWVQTRVKRLCSNCGHPRNGEGVCEIQGCVCNCIGRAQLDDLTVTVSSGENSAHHHPTHYNTSKIEVWDAIVAWDLDFLTGSAIKYIARAGKKDPAKHIEDLKKAREFIDKAIAVEEAKDEA